MEQDEEGIESLSEARQRRERCRRARFEGTL